MDYLDRKDAQRVAAEETLRHPPETAVERDLRGKIAELTLDLQSLRAQVSKSGARRMRAMQTQAANGAPAAQTVARVEKLGKDLATKVDGQVARVERLERHRRRSDRHELDRQGAEGPADIGRRRARAVVGTAGPAHARSHDEGQYIRSA